jgi:hypothetical protein
MLGNSHNGSSAGNKSWGFAGLGSNYGLQPYPDTLHRGYGWGRMTDSDFFPEPVVWDFRSNATQATGSAKERNKTQFPLSWH